MLSLQRQRCSAARHDREDLDLERAADLRTLADDVVITQSGDRAALDLGRAE
jgi:hypothetical protein